AGRLQHLCAEASEGFKAQRRLCDQDVLAREEQDLSPRAAAMARMAAMIIDVSDDAPTILVAMVYDGIWRARPGVAAINNNWSGGDVANVRRGRDERSS
ncbi:MAG: hypothetical protein Q9181_002578, partial [Wetmoreana brouardii]